MTQVLPKTLLGIGLSVWVLTAGAVEFATNRALVGQDDPIEVKLRFNEPDSGDLYVAVQVGDKLFFYGEDGSFSEQAIPRSRAGQYSGEIGLFYFPPGVVPSFPYILYAVVTNPGANVFDPNNWHGGWDGLARELVQVGNSFFGPGDLDDDGYYDDDFDRNGFHDDDRNYDGYHDDDLNQDGWHDDDRDHDGQHDDHNPSQGDSVRGQTLYAQHCSGCHGQVPDARRRGKDAEDIAEAIAQNKGGMGFLAGVLSSSELQDLAAYLNSSSSSNNNSGFDDSDSDDSSDSDGLDGDDDSGFDDSGSDNSSDDDGLDDNDDDREEDDDD